MRQVVAPLLAVFSVEGLEVVGLEGFGKFGSFEIEHLLSWLEVRFREDAYQLEVECHETEVIERGCIF